MFKKILFPVDLSQTSTKISPYVIRMADKFDSEIHIIFVARVMEHYAGLYVPNPAIKTFEAEIIRGAERKLSEFLENVFPRRQVRAKVVSGDPAEEILNYAGQEKIDLIIMGTHGRKGIERVLFGSVAEQVIKKSSSPVLSVNPFRVDAQ